MNETIAKKYIVKREGKKSCREYRIIGWDVPGDVLVPWESKGVGHRGRVTFIEQFRSI
jgi:hypothetical protein